jgi:hypothetical protein
MMIAFTGCGEKPQSTMSNRETDKASEAIKDYEKNNSAEQKGRVDLAFAELDQEIRELEIRVERTEGEARAEAARKLEGLRQRKDELKGDFTEAKFKALLEDIKTSVK